MDRHCRRRRADGHAAGAVRPLLPQPGRHRHRHGFRLLAVALEAPNRGRRVIVVGAGIAGLAVGYALQKAGRPATILEAADRPGGVIRTERVGDYLVEGGPDSLLVAKPWGAALCRELGIELVPVLSRQVYVLARGRLVPLPEGLLLTVPARLGPFLRSPLISPLGKLRMALDLLLPRRGGGDESLGAFVRRRLGREALEMLAAPLMAGIYLADPDRLSLAATFPRFIEMERRHRSLLLAARRVPRSTTPTFEAPAHGMGAIVDSLAARLDLQCQCRVIAIGPAADVRPGTNGCPCIGARWRVYAVGPAGPATYDADAVVLAVPAHAAATLLAPVAAEASTLLRATPYVDSATVAFGFDGVSLPAGTGFVVPVSEGRRLVAASFSSQKFAHRAPPGHVLLRGFMIGAPEVDVALTELRQMLGIRAEPTFVRAFSWPGANPIYEVGHLERVRRIDALLPPGIHLVGAGYHGIGIPDAVHDAQQAAARIGARRPQ